MALPNPPTFVKRLVKGTPLTHAEGDGNLDKITAYLQMLSALFGVAINSDGTLNDDSVATVNLQDRSVTERKLGPASVFPPKNDSGSTNAIVIVFDPELTAYADGQVFGVFVANNNTGPVTLRAGATLAALPVKKSGGLDLEANDVVADSFALFAYRSGTNNFRLLATASSSTSSGGSTATGFSGFEVYQPLAVAIPPIAAVAATGTLTSSGVNVSNGDTVVIGARTYTFQTVLTNVDGNVLIGASATASMTNLFNAINDTGGGTPGTDYAAATTPHPTVTATNPSATQVVVTAITAGVGGNSIATTETAATLAWGAATLTGGITDTFASFVHGLSASPELYVTLICISTDLGFAVGKEIPISDFTDAAGIPAFTVSADATSIIIQRQTATIEAGGYGPIVDAKWNILVRASVKTAVAAPLFPALSITAKDPQGALAYGNALIYVTYGANQNVYYPNRLDLASNNIRLLDVADVNPLHGYCNFAPFLRASGLPEAIYTSSTGYFRLTLTEPSGTWKPVNVFTHAGRYTGKPVHLVESGGNITEIYTAECVYGYGNVNSIPLYVATTGAALPYGTNLDLTSATIKSADGTAGNVEFRRWHPGAGGQPNLFQYNPVKKRIYVSTTETNMIHIFKILTAADFKTWWDLAAATRAADLQYVKTVAIGGVGDNSDGNVLKESMCIDFDLSTGAERALVFCRGGSNPTYGYGSVTRVPWKE